MALNASRSSLNVPPLPPRPNSRGSQLSVETTHLEPPKLPPRPRSAEPSRPPTPSLENVAQIEEDMSEQQLRELYDNEEIERFLNLFSAYVTEVRAPEHLPKDSNSAASANTVSFSTFSEDAEGSDDGDWVGVDQTAPVEEAIPLREANSLSESISFRYLLPILPPPRPAPPFTVGRLRLTTQRLYLAVVPVYMPFLEKSVKLATWKDWNKSAKYCTIFWLLWYQNLILPAIVLRIFYSLLRRRIFPYPTVKELRRRRAQVDRAATFGNEVQQRLSVSSFGVKEMWRLIRVFNKGKKNKLKDTAKEKGKGKAKGKSEDMIEEANEGNGAFDEVAEESRVEGTEEETVLDTSKDGSESKEVKDMKRAGLVLMSEIADLHERMKNLFIWRRPNSSRLYGAIIFGLFLVTLLLPAQYIAKLTYFVLGVLFWHIIPIVAALPPDDRARLPPAFGDLPTDADYAMELISLRVAAGLDVRPTNTKRAKKERRMEKLAEEGDAKAAHKLDSKQVNWKKWGERVAIGKAWADDGKRLFTSGQLPNPASPLKRAPVPIPRMAWGETESHTFPVQHATAPGLVTLTQTTLVFTPLMSAHPKLIIPLKEVSGVKKTGMLKGLSVKWGEEGKEEKFRWVGGRDELFARLIGADGRKWIRN